jgi:hypothetical protein
MADTKETVAETPAAPSDPAPPYIETPASTSAVEPEKTIANDTSTEAPVLEKSSSDGWPALDAGHPLSRFVQALPEILKSTGYNEVYGVALVPEGNFHTKLILQKFLRANQNDLEKAKEQLTKTLTWRKEYQPLKVKDEVFSSKKFGGLGYITKLSDVPGSENKTDVATFNIYGAVKDNKETFGDVEAFMRWRVALMESSVLKLGLAEATAPIPDYGEGPDIYQGFQIHDYMDVSFLRQDPLVKAASKKAIEVFGAYYRKSSPLRAEQMY